MERKLNSDMSIDGLIDILELKNEKITDLSYNDEGKIILKTDGGN